MFGVPFDEGDYRRRGRAGPEPDHDVIEIDLVAVGVLARGKRGLEDGGDVGHRRRFRHLDADEASRVVAFEEEGTGSLRKVGRGVVFVLDFLLRVLDGHVGRARLGGYAENGDRVHAGRCGRRYGVTHADLHNFVNESVHWLPLRGKCFCR